MNIQLEKLNPEYLEIPSKSDIWHTTAGLEKGKIYQIVAPSGRGKSSFVGFLYGTRKNYRGTIHFEDKNTRTLDSYQWAEYRQKKISVVFQDLRLFPDLTGQENILLKAELTGPVSDNTGRDMADALGVIKLLDKKCGTMSFGERQRIAIIRALVQPFDWIFLDEPFSHLDSENKTRAASIIIEEIRKKGAGGIFTSLDADNSMEYDERLYL